MNTPDADDAKEQLARGIEEGEEWARSDDATQDHVFEAMGMVSSWGRGEYLCSSSRSRNDDARSFFDTPDEDGNTIGARLDPCEVFREGFVRGVALVGDEQRTAALDQLREDINTMLAPRTNQTPKDGQEK